MKNDNYISKKGCRLTIRMRVSLLGQALYLRGLAKRLSRFLRAPDYETAYERTGDKNNI